MNEQRSDVQTHDFVIYLEPGILLEMNGKSTDGVSEKDGRYQQVTFLCIVGIMQDVSKILWNPSVNHPPVGPSSFNRYPTAVSNVDGQTYNLQYFIALLRPKPLLAFHRLIGVELLIVLLDHGRDLKSYDPVFEAKEPVNHILEAVEGPDGAKHKYTFELWMGVVPCLAFLPVYDNEE